MGWEEVWGGVLSPVVDRLHPRFVVDVHPPALRHIFSSPAYLHPVVPWLHIGYPIPKCTAFVDILTS